MSSNQAIQQDLFTLAQQAQALLNDEDELETLQSQFTAAASRVEILQTQLDLTLKHKLKAQESAHFRMLEINEELKAARALPEYKTADQQFKEVKENAGINELNRERKEIRQAIIEDLEDDQEIQYLREQAAEAAESAASSEELISHLRVRNRAASRHIIQQTALIAQLPLL